MYVRDRVHLGGILPPKTLFDLPLSTTAQDMTFHLVPQQMKTPLNVMHRHAEPYLMVYFPPVSQYTPHSLSRY